MSSQIDAWQSQQHALEIMKKILDDIADGILEHDDVTSTVKRERKKSLFEKYFIRAESMMGPIEHIEHMSKQDRPE